MQDQPIDERVKALLGQSSSVPPCPAEQYEYVADLTFEIDDATITLHEVPAGIYTEDGAAALTDAMILVAARTHASGKLRTILDLLHWEDLSETELSSVFRVLPVNQAAIDAWDAQYETTHDRDGTPLIDDDDDTDDDYDARFAY